MSPSSRTPHRYAVGIRTHHGVRRFLSRTRFGRLTRGAVAWKLTRSRAVLFSSYEAADRAARAEALNAAGTREVTVYSVEAGHGGTRWHAIATFDSRAAGGHVRYGAQTAEMAKISVPRAGDR